MSRKTVSMIGNLTRDMMSDVMETSLKKPIQTGEFRKNPFTGLLAEKPWAVRM